MNDMKNKRSVRSVLIYFFASLLFIGAVLVVARYNSTLEKQFYTERSGTLMTVTQKCAECMDEIIHAGWQKLFSAEKLLLSEEMEDSLPNSRDRLPDLAARLGELTLTDTKEKEAGELILLDAGLKLYSSGGRQSRWNETGVLACGEDGTNICLSRLPYHAADETQIFLIRELDRTIAVGDTEITHLLFAIPADSLANAFLVQEYQDSSFVYIVGEDGERLCRYTQSAEFIDSFNVFHAIEEGSYVAGNTLEEMREALREDKGSVCTAFRYRNTEYYAASAGLSSGDWFLILFVPRTVLAENSDAFRASTYTFFVILLLITVFGVMLILYNIMRLSGQEKLNRQQKEANEQLALAAEKAEAASSAKTVFLSNMSHDIRTPINGIIGMTTIAKKEPGIPPRVMDCLDKIDGSSQHLLSLINDVLDMSRIESGKTVIAHDPIDIRTVSVNCASIIRGQMDGRELRFIEDFAEPEHPYLFGDELRIRQILINILGNAVKFTPDGGTIRFAMRETGAENGHASIEYTVSDTGIGMKPEFLEKIWDSFSQAEAGARSKYKGTGLGMAITKQFVDLMHGDIRVESTFGEGSTFTVTLPLDIDESAHIQEIDEEFVVDLHGKHILLAEDNELNAEIAVELLSDEGIEVTPVVNGLEALNRFAENPPGTFDLILMDIMMPEMDGLEATRRIRALEREDAARIPIIAMSANAFEEDIRKSRDSGMNAHLSKPIDIAECIKTLENYLA